MYVLSSAAAASWDEVMVDRAIAVGIVTVALGVLACVVRLFRGPHLADRAVASDTIAIHIIALVVLLTLRIDSLVLVDGALVLSLVGFVSTVAVAQYILRPHRRRGSDAGAPARQDA